MSSSSQPRMRGSTMRCADEEIGRNSVSPCTIPMTIAWRIGSTQAPCSDGRAASRDDRTGGPSPAGRMVVGRGGEPRDQRMNSGANTSVSVASSFTRTWSDGPAVSLNGSPTVSPTTAAAWAVGALAQHVAVVVRELPGLDVLLGVVPGATAVVQVGGQEHAGDRAHHEQAGHRLVAEEDADDDRRRDRDDAGRDHLAQRGPRRDVDDARVVRAAGCSP